MDFSQLASRVTGFSIPFFGMSWSPPETEIAHARRAIAFLEDRRVLYNTFAWEEPDHCNRSVIEIRAFLTNELQSLNRDSEISRRLSTLRAACRKFLDTMQQHGIGGRRALQGMSAEFIFSSAIGELRGVFGLQTLLLAQSYGLPVEDDLASIFPFQDDPKLES